MKTIGLLLACITLVLLSGCVTEQLNQPAITTTTITTTLTTDSTTEPASTRVTTTVTTSTSMESICAKFVKKSQEVETLCRKIGEDEWSPRTLNADVTYVFDKHVGDKCRYNMYGASLMMPKHTTCQTPTNLTLELDANLFP